MSIDQTGLGPSGGTGAASGGMSSGGTGGGGTTASASEMAGAVKEQGGEVAAKAAEAGKNVAQETKAQASQVVGQAKEQIHTVVGQARTEVQGQLDAKASQAAGGLRTLSEQLNALQQGRPEQAGQIGTYISEAQRAVTSFAERIDRDGVQGVMNDVTQFARRRPGLFLLGAATVGFAMGRTLRAGMAASQEDGSNGSSGAMYSGSSDYGSAAYGSGEYGSGEYGMSGSASDFASTGADLGVLAGSATSPAESTVGGFAPPTLGTTVGQQGTATWEQEAR